MTSINTTRGVSFKPSGNHSKAAWLRAQAIKASEALQVEECYEEYAPKQVFHQDEMQGRNDLGIDLSRRAA